MIGKIDNDTKIRIEFYLIRLGSIELFDRNALMLCASKVASTTGDLRTVFDVCR
jgi:hypothetical protein